MPDVEIRVKCSPEFKEKLEKARGIASLSAFVRMCVEEKIEKIEDEKREEVLFRAYLAKMSLKGDEL